MSARQKAKNSGTEWSLILEDDAEFGEPHFSRLMEILPTLSPLNPEIILFGSDMAAHREGAEGIHVIPWKPTGAVSVCYSAAALSLFSKDSTWKHDVADFPGVLVKARFWLVDNHPVGGVEDSIIGERRVDRFSHIASLALRFFLAPWLGRVLGLSALDVLRWYFIRTVWSDARVLRSSRQNDLAPPSD
jgi:hypothetical protein